MITTGQELKKRLQLSNFPHVKIRRVISGSSVKIYQVVFNSRRYSHPITHTQLRNSILIPRLTDGEGDVYSGTPWADIENFNGSLRPAIFSVVDLAGVYGVAKNYTEKYVSFGFNNRLEEITIPELRRVDTYTSSKTKDFKKQRFKFQGQGVKNTKFMDSFYIPETGSLQFLFVTEATEIAKSKRSHRMTKAKVDVKQFYNVDTDSLEDNPSKTYDLYLQLENVFPNKHYSDLSWLEVYNGEEVTTSMMKELLEVADVKMHDTNPSFQFQGFRYRLSRIDAAIYPEDRPDDVWRGRHNDNAYLGKHFSQLFDKGTFDIFLNQMNSALRKHCKELGYGKSVKGKVLINIKGDKE